MSADKSFITISTEGLPVEEITVIKWEVENNICRATDILHHFIFHPFFLPMDIRTMSYARNNVHGINPKLVNKYGVSTECFRELFYKFWMKHGQVNIYGIDGDESQFISGPFEWRGRELLMKYEMITYPLKPWSERAYDPLHNICHFIKDNTQKTEFEAPIHVGWNGNQKYCNVSTFHDQWRGNVNSKWLNETTEKRLRHGISCAYIMAIELGLNIAFQELNIETVYLSSCTCIERWQSPTLTYVLSRTLKNNGEEGMFRRNILQRTTSQTYRTFGPWDCDSEPCGVKV